jgi:DNA replicative helicase MCM subunit Mcm2 (Cdc46/Mcm family)
MLIDEMDKMSANEQVMLLNLMETGKVSGNKA